jgi:hypothetical protein
VTVAGEYAVLDHVFSWRQWLYGNADVRAIFGVDND